MKFGVVVFPGSNCDHDTYFALKDRLETETVYLWHKDHDLRDVDCVVLPGGFSYGDYLRPGAIARFSPLMKELAEFADRGGIVLGICNGFQVLLEIGLLPGAMLRNKNLKFLCQHVHLCINNTDTPFSLLGNRGQVLKMPIAHFDGNYYVREDILQDIKRNGQIVFQYCDAGGNVSDKANVNGSVNNIAGLTNKQGNVLGVMPHPERASDLCLGSDDGRLVFRSVIKWLER